MPAAVATTPAANAQATVATLAQGTLGDADSKKARREAVLDEAKGKLALLPNNMLTKPKHILGFTTHLTYKQVLGGQQLTCSCMFCGKKVISTGAVKIVAHMATCIMCPAEVRDPCRALQESAKDKRTSKAEHEAIVSAEKEEELLVLKAQ